MALCNRCGNQYEPTSINREGQCPKCYFETHKTIYKTNTQTGNMESAKLIIVHFIDDGGLHRQDITCPECGKYYLNDSMNYCPNCGVKFEKEPKQ